MLYLSRQKIKQGKKAEKYQSPSSSINPAAIWQYCNYFHRVMQARIILTQLCFSPSDLPTQTSPSPRKKTPYISDRPCRARACDPKRLSARFLSWLALTQVAGQRRCELRMRPAGAPLFRFFALARAGCAKRAGAREKERERKCVYMHTSRVHVYTYISPYVNGRAFCLLPRSFEFVRKRNET